MSRACTHGLSDAVEITSKAVIENYRYKTRSTCFGYWCQQHQAFGTFTVEETEVQYPVRESTAPDPAV